MRRWRPDRCGSPRRPAPHPPRGPAWAPADAAAGPARSASGPRSLPSAAKLPTTWRLVIAPSGTPGRSGRSRRCGRCWRSELQGARESAHRLPAAAPASRKRAGYRPTAGRPRPRLPNQSAGNPGSLHVARGGRASRAPPRSARPSGGSGAGERSRIGARSIRSAPWPISFATSARLSIGLPSAPPPLMHTP